MKFTKEIIEPSRTTAKSQGIDFMHDRWGINTYSRVRIETERVFQDRGAFHDEAKDFMLALVNSFIKIYRSKDSKEIHLHPLISQDLIDFSLHPANQSGFASIELTFGGGGITGIDPQLINRVSTEVQEHITQNKLDLPLCDDLLINAEHHIFTCDFNLSILECITALEISVNAFLWRKGREQNLTSKQIRNELIGAGRLKANVGILLPLLADLSPLPADTLAACIEGIRLRNKIAHEGKMDIKIEEAQAALTAIRRLIPVLA